MQASEFIPSQSALPPWRGALLAGACLGLAACAQLAPKPQIREVRVEVQVPVPVSEPADIAARQLLTHDERLRRLNPAELAQEVGPREDATLAPPAATQLALALAYSHGAGELARAQALLEQVLHSGAAEAAAWQPLARLLGARIAEQRRLEEQIDKLNQQGRDNQRKVEQLNEKLEALKAIERSLNTRPTTPPAKGSPP